MDSIKTTNNMSAFLPFQSYQILRFGVGAWALFSVWGAGRVCGASSSSGFRGLEFGFLDLIFGHSYCSASSGTFVQSGALLMLIVNSCGLITMGLGCPNLIKVNGSAPLAEAIYRSIAP